MSLKRGIDAKDLRRIFGPGGFGGFMLDAIVRAAHTAAAQGPGIARSEIHRTVPKPIATGEYRQSWRWTRLAARPGAKNRDLAIVGSGVRHAIFVEAGRRSGAKPPPVYVIERWMAVKGIPGGRSRAFAIARSIGRRGIRPKPVMGTTADRVCTNWKKQIGREFLRAAAKIGR